MDKLALITGASSGLGYQLATILANHYHYNLIVVARRRERLEQLKENLATNVMIIVADLATDAGKKSLFAVIENQKIDLVINNAGLGDCQYFHLSDINKQKTMIDVNITALTEITHYFLQRFIKQNSGRIVNIGSAAGFIEGPLMAGYYASKNYVRVLTNSLNHELKMIKSKVRVSLICPGPFESEFAAKAAVDFHGLLEEKFLYQSTYKLALYCLKKVFKNKRIIIPGKKQKIMLMLAKISPATVTRNVVARYQKRKQ